MKFARLQNNVVVEIYEGDELFPMVPDLAATWQQVEESTLVGFTLQNGVWAAPPVAPLTPKEQIDILEMTVTARRMRESVLGIDNGWLLNVNNQIAALRGQITE